MTAVRVAEPPAIDGLLADDAWRRAARLSTFVQTAPVEGATATEPTEVYLAYDGENLYVGIRARYAEPGLMRANRADRDQIAEDDTVSLFFDPFRDRQRAYQFTVNGFGVQGDAILNSTGLRNRSQRRALGARNRGPANTPPSGIPEGDISWDALFVSAGAPSEDGWTAELAIPFKSLRYPPVDEGESHRWGFQVSRSIKGKDETVVWSPVSRSIAQFLAQMGVLEGLTDLSTSRNLEILPTVPAFRSGALDAAGAFVDDDVAEAGLNLKYGISSDLTADFTINPDFSQIESDLPQIDVKPAVPALLPRAAALLPGGAGDLQRLRADHADPYADHHRSPLRRKGERQGGAQLGRRPLRRRRGAGQAGRHVGTRRSAGRPTSLSVGRASISTRSRSSGRR